MKSKLNESRPTGCCVRGISSLSIFCPACKEVHHIRLKESTRIRPSWDWDHNLENPTLSPDIKIKECHFKITNGFIEYLPDCNHEYAGQTLELPDIE